MLTVLTVLTEQPCSPRPGRTASGTMSMGTVSGP
ncbi:hypothetical protein ABIA31_004283 [Catenulispora sp. MAP5-51]